MTVANKPATGAATTPDVRPIDGRVTRELPRELPREPHRSPSSPGAPRRSSSMPLSSMSSPATASRVSIPPTIGANAAPRLPPVPATCEPRVPYRSWFTGAVLPICDVEVLIVVVQPRIMFDTYEANLFVTAFNLRFKRTIVLLSQDVHTLVPTFYGPAGIVRALSTLPFEMIPWQRMLYRVAKVAHWKLPIPPERPPHDSSLDADSSAGSVANETRRYHSSSEDLALTHIRDPGAANHEAANDRDSAARIARTTRR